MEQSISTNDKRFYSVLIIAIIALVIGAAGLAVGLMRPQTPPGSTAEMQVPSGGPLDGSGGMTPGVESKSLYKDGEVKSGSTHQ